MRTNEEKVGILDKTGKDMEENRKITDRTNSQFIKKNRKTHWFMRNKPKQTWKEKKYITNKRNKSH